MKEHVYLRGGGRRMNFIVHTPDSGTDGLPLLVYLHGAGERGGTAEHLYRHGVPQMIREGREFGAVTLCPQCPESSVWNNVTDDVMELIVQTAERYSVKRDRICITGSSMGGFGTWEMVASYPSFFSAAAPVAGGGMSWRAPNFVGTPIWALHGSADTAVPPVYSQLMTEAVKKLGGDVRLTMLEGFGHNDGIDEAYLHTGVLDWLLASRRTDFSVIPETLSGYFTD